MPVPLARVHDGPGSATVIASLALLRLHVSVDHIGDGRISAACLVLVDDRGTLAVVGPGIVEIGAFQGDVTQAVEAVGLAKHVSGVYKNMTRAIVNRVFRCKITGGALATNDEATDFRRASEAEVPGLMNEAYAIRVLDALRESATAAVRSHDGVHLL